MATVNLTLTNITIMEDGNYNVQVTTPTNATYTVKLTPAQCASLLTIQSALESIAQPLKFIGQMVTITV